MKFFCGIAFFLTSFITNAQNPNFSWATSAGDTTSDIGNDVVVDGAGNAYTTGYFNGTVDFDPGPLVNTLTSNGNKDIFVLKQNPAGDLLWAIQIGGTLNDEAKAIDLDANGNVYVTGYFDGLVDFDPGAGSSNLNGTLIDLFVLKLDNSGAFVWAKQIGGSTGDEGNDIELDDAGNIYLTGLFNGTVDFDPGAGTSNLTSNGQQDVFICKLNNAGDHIWSRQMGGTGIDIGYSLAVDASGNVFSTGHFSEIADFDPGAGTENLTSAGDWDIFLVKLDANGLYNWSVGFGDVESDAGRSISTDSIGNVYLGGYYRGTVDFDPGTGTTNLTAVGDGDALLLKMNTNGNLLWAKSMGGPKDEFVLAMDLDENGNVYSTGYFANTADFDPGTGTYELEAYFQNDSSLVRDMIFISKLNNNGDFVWALNFDAVKGRGISATNKTVHTTGYFTGTIDFDPGADTSNLTGNGHDDIFVQKLTCLSASTQTITACNSYIWMDGLTYTSSNNTATFPIAGGAINGCDSVVQLDLTIESIDISLSPNGSMLTSNQNGANYQWLDCLNNYAALTGATSQSYTATANGSYAVEITKNGCVDTSNCFNVTGVGLLDHLFGSTVRVYPNPSEGTFTIGLPSIFPEITTKVYALNGQLIGSETHFASTTLQIAIDAAPGCYLLEIWADERQVENVLLFLK